MSRRVRGEGVGAVGVVGLLETTVRLLESRDGSGAARVCKLMCVCANVYRLS